VTGRVSELDAPGPTLRDPRAAACLDAAWKALARSPASLAGDELLLRSVNLLRSRGLQRETSPAARRNQQTLERVRDYLHARLDQHVTTTELAAVASMSRFQLTRQFQAQYGLPLHGYHLHLRLEEAKRRLRRGQPVAAVATDLGFADQSHFHRRFRGSFGITPGAWRAAHGYKTSADARGTVDSTHGAARGTDQAFRGTRRDP
jgi:AraC-like DNA-binding protein